MIKYNTLYQSLKKVSAEWHAGHVQWQYSWNYLKFYENGSVIYVSSTGKPNEMDWLNAGNKNAFLYTGNFKLQNDFKLEIEIPVHIGLLKLDGAVLENKLILRSFNQEMNLYENWDEYLIPNIFI